MKQNHHTILRKIASRSLALALLPCFAMNSIAADDDSPQLACFSPDHTKIMVKAPGIQEFTFSSDFRATIDGRSVSLSTNNGKVEKTTEWSEIETPLGKGESASATYSNPEKTFSYTVTVTVLEEQNAVAVQGTFHNNSGKDALLNEVTAINTTAGGALKVADPADWLVTPLMLADEAKPLTEANGGFSEAALVCDKTGSGFLIGPTGPPEAFGTVEVSKGNVKAYSQMDGVLVRSGESRKGEQQVLAFGTPTETTSLWTKWVAATHGTRLDRGPVYGWCSWYDRTTKIDEKHVRDVLKTLADNPNVFGKGILQIDDGYQIMDGNWKGNQKFPSGMAKVAEDIRAKGWIPGVWFAPLMINPEHPWMKANPDAIQKDAKGISSFMNPNPFHPDGANWIVPDHPESKKFLFHIIKDARDNGYGYIKIDFNGIGNRFHDPTKTRLQIFRELYTLYREAAGEDMYILSCLGAPTRGVIGFVDAARVGPDSHPAHFEWCLHSVLRFQIFDNVWWQNDPDVSYLAKELPSRVVGKTQTEGMWRTWHNIVTLVGGTAMNSEPLNTPDAREVWRMVEIMRPASAEPATLLTLGTSPHNTAFGFTAKRPYGDFGVWNLYNVSEGPKTAHDKPHKDSEPNPAKSLTLDFAKAGLPTGTECAVFDFWKNKVVSRATGSYTTAPLEDLASAMVRITPLTGDGPLLVGSNLHLSMGATEIADIKVSSDALEVVLTDAGAQDGSLTFHSTKPLAAGSSENCEIAGVESLGDNLWRVNLKGRLWGKPQSVRLALK
jgi:alpha-galactosidase